jgi:hypothetical protein
MDLDPNKVTNSMQDAAIQAEILKGFQQPAPPPPEMAGPGGPAPQEGAVPAGVNPQDQTGAGGGTIGTGVAPVPGEEGFSGNVA